MKTNSKPAIERSRCMSRRPFFQRSRLRLTAFLAVSFVVAINNTSGQTTYEATDDAHVSSLNPNNTYGMNAVLTQNATYVTNGYFKFNLAGLSSVKSALFKFKAHSFSTPSLDLAIYPATDTAPSWSETSVTWNTRPARGPTALGTVTVNSSPPSNKELDVSSYIKGELHAGRTLVTLSSHKDAVGPGMISIADRLNISHPHPRLEIVPNNLPTLALTAPAPSSTFHYGNAITLSATASDSDGSIAKVEFLVDDAVVGEDTTSPYSIIAYLAPGAHTVKARAIDNDGGTATTAPVNISVLHDGLTAYYKFDEGSGSTANDSSGNGYPGSISSPSWTSGRIGPGSLFFNGLLYGSAGESLVTIDNTPLRVLPAGPFSVSLWINVDDPIQSSRAILMRAGNGTDVAWHLGIDKDAGGIPHIVWHAESYDLWGAAPALTAGNWHHILLTYHSPIGTIYLDGQKLVSGIRSIQWGMTSIAIGGGVSGLMNFAGNIDDVKFYSRELTPADALTTGHWRFDDNTGTTAADSSGHAGTATTYNTTWTAARKGVSSLAFNGDLAWADGSMVFANNLNYHLLPETGRPFSISMWINPDSLPAGQWQGLAGNDQFGGLSGWRLALHNAGPGTNNLVFWSNQTGGSLYAAGRSVLLPGQWYHITTTYSGSGNGSVGRVYLDGKLIASGTGNISANTDDLYIGGAVGFFNSFHGKIDEVRVFQKELNPQEISLQGFWRLDELTGTLGQDSSGQGKHGQLAKPSWSTSLHLTTNSMTCANADYSLFPRTGGEFSISMSLYPQSIASGLNGVMACSTTTDGWKFAVYRDSGAGTNAFRFWSTDSGGTLDCWASAAGLGIDAWTKVTITFNGGIATIYVNGENIRSDSGGIKGSAASFQMGALAGIPNLNGFVDEVKIYNRALEDYEFWPRARVVWETVMKGGSTNVKLAVAGPADKVLTHFIIDPPANGTVEWLPDFTATYTPNTGYSGPDAFTYVVTDGELESPPTIVHMSVVKPHWLQPGASFSGTGTSADPWIIPPDTSVNYLDNIWATYKDYDCFFYSPGIYETRGARPGVRGSANPGCKHIGFGTDETTIRLVKTRGSLTEGTIFAPVDGWCGSVDDVYADDFEVHDMTLDCNAANNPKYAPGEPCTLAIISPVGPMTFDRIRLFWDTTVLPFSEYRLGRAKWFSIFATNEGVGTIIYTTTSGAGGVDDIYVGSVTADKVALVMYERGPNVDFYSLSEFEILSGGLNIAVGKPIVYCTEEGMTGSLLAPERAVDDNENTQWASSTQGQLSAINLAGNNLKLRNLKIIGFGTKAGKECFPFYSGPVCEGTLPRNLGNVLIENCVITEPATANADGCTAFVMVQALPSTLTNGVIRNCAVFNLWPSFKYSQGFGAAHVENCFTENVHVGIYFEPNKDNGPFGDASVGPVLIRSNTFVNCNGGILINSHADSGIETVTFINNEIVLFSTHLGWAMINYAEPGGTVTNMTVLNNLVRLPDWSPSPAWGGIHISNMRNATYGNNVVVLDLASVSTLRLAEGFDPPRPGYRRAVFNNRDLMGTILHLNYRPDENSPFQDLGQWP